MKISQTVTNKNKKSFTSFVEKAKVPTTNASLMTLQQDKFATPTASFISPQIKTIEP